MNRPLKPSHPMGEVRLITSDGVRLHARWYPVADPVSGAPSFLLGHGFTGSAGAPTVIAIAQHVADSGIAVLSLDFRGHGRSAGRSSVGVTEVADVAAGVAWLRRQHPNRPVILLGFSMGASVVIRYAGLGGDADAVIAVGGPGRWFVRTSKPMRRLNRGLETRLGRVVLAGIFATRVDQGWEDLPKAPVEVAAGVAVPMLVVHGEADPYFGLEHPRMLAAAAPNCDLWLEPGMGHAESATSTELLDRMTAWALASVGGSASMA